MAVLSFEQLQFLSQQKIPLSRVFNATGMAKLDYQGAMKELGMMVAFGVSACSKAGHTLRTRAGHCAQCNTAALAFILRYDDPAEVYVAYSFLNDFTKIGVANDHQGRLRSLNDQAYGGINDWSIKYFCKCNKAGRVEFLAQQKLSKYRMPREYCRSGRIVECQELFKCKALLGVQAVKKAVMEIN